MGRGRSSAGRSLAKWVGIERSAIPALRKDGAVVRIEEWPGLDAARRLRQWPHVVRLANAAAVPPFVGLVLLGSFVRGEADDLSDIDFIVFASEDHFPQVWEQRHTLHPDDACCWDYPRRPTGVR
jgi:Nucleotidyltransferase domain